MPISAVAVEQTLFGRITEVTTIPSDFTESKLQIRVTVQPIDPLATKMRLLFFGYEAKPAPNSKWIQFVKSFNVSRIKAIPGIAAISDGEDMVGSFIKVGFEERSGKIKDRKTGEQTERTWQEPRVREFYADDKLCFATWRIDNPEIQEAMQPVEQPMPEAAPSPAVPEAKPPVPKEIEPFLAAMWKKAQNAGQSFDVFWAGIKETWGFDEGSVRQLLLPPQKDVH